MKSKWPTLEGRLNNPLTTEKEALLQLQETMPLTDYATKKLKKLCVKSKNTNLPFTGS
jgi:hypothetical protein